MRTRHVGIATLGLALLAGAARAADVDDCNTPVPVPSAAARVLAEAYWLDARTVQWPGLKLQAGERLRLHHAKAAGLRATAGAAVAGSDGAVELQPSATALPARRTSSSSSSPVSGADVSPNASRHVLTDTE